MYYAFSGFIYSLTSTGARVPICSLNGKQGIITLSDPNYSGAYPNNTSLLECDIDRKSGNIDSPTFGIICNSGSAKILDAPSVYENGFSVNGVDYLNLSNYLTHTQAICYIDFYFFTRYNKSGVYTIANSLINTFKISDFSYDDKNHQLSLVLVSRLLDLQKHIDRLPLLKCCNDVEYLDGLYTSDSITSIVSYYENIITDIIKPGTLKFDTDTDAYINSWVLPRPYANEASVWNALQKLCQAFGLNIFEDSNQDIRIEYSYVMR